MKRRNVDVNVKGLQIQSHVLLKTVSLREKKGKPVKQHKLSGMYTPNVEL